MTLTENTVYTKEDFTVNPLPKAEYDYCTFNGCLFNDSDISGVIFNNCTFTDCNLSNPKVRAASFKDAVFKNCKMLGFNFSNCDPFLLSASFEECYLNLASFYGLKMKATKFIKCSLQEADFTEADFTNASFKGSNLLNAIFDRTILEKADFRTATGYAMDPEKNRLKKAKFSREGIAGLLHKYNIDID